MKIKELDLEKLKGIINNSIDYSIDEYLEDNDYIDSNYDDDSIIDIDGLKEEILLMILKLK